MTLVQDHRQTSAAWARLRRDLSRRRVVQLTGAEMRLLLDQACPHAVGQRARAVVIAAWGSNAVLGQVDALAVVRILLILGERLSTHRLARGATGERNLRNAAAADSQHARTLT